MLKAGQSESINTLIGKMSNAWPEERWCDSNVIVGVSGGADSVALLHLLKMIQDRAKNKRSTGRGKLIALYCNHKTRPECQNEQEFVFQLAKKLECQCVCKEVDVGTSEKKPSEQSLRTFRYSAFLETAQEYGARYVATAHHADDQVETVLFRIFRGTGLSGLSGIPALRVESDVSFVRPMLEVSRSELRQFLTDIEQPFCEDASNQDSSYARNFIRHQILPVAKDQFGPGLSESILRLAEQAELFNRFMDDAVDAIFTNNACIEDNRAAIKTEALRDESSLIVTYVLRSVWKKMGLPEQEMTHQRWLQLTDAVVSGDDTKIQLPGKITVSISSSELIIERTLPFVRKNGS